MAPVQPLTPLLDEPTASFMQSGVSIIAASTDRQNLPTIVRVFGCLVSRDRRKVTLLAPGFEPFAAAVSATRTIAVTFTRPSTHEAIQVKGTDAQTVRCSKHDSGIMSAYADAMVDELGRLGYSESFVRAMVWSDPRGLSPISFHPNAAFLQTPGPRAGTPMAATKGTTANTP